MVITTLEARERILEELGAAVDGAALAVACLGAAYEQLSVMAADRLEAELYRPVQKAYGRGKRTHDQFAERSGLPGREFDPPSAGRPSQGVKAFVEGALNAAASADHRVAELQDSLLPIESGDAELRAGLAEMRDLLGELPSAVRVFLRTLGR